MFGQRVGGRVGGLGCASRLVDAERGPRLPTLFLALGAEKVRALLTP